MTFGHGMVGDMLDISAMNSSELGEGGERGAGNVESAGLSQRLRRIANDLRHLSESDPAYSKRMRIAQEELHAISSQLRRMA
jgi:hypothetical protein